MKTSYTINTHQRIEYIYTYIYVYIYIYIHTSLYMVISFLGKQVDLENKLQLITPKQKRKFNVKRDSYKNKVEFELGKVQTKKSFSKPRDNILNN